MGQQLNSQAKNYADSIVPPPAKTKPELTAWHNAYDKKLKEINAAKQTPQTPQATTAQPKSTIPANQNLICLGNSGKAAKAKTGGTGTTQTCTAVNCSTKLLTFKAAHNSTRVFKLELSASNISGNIEVLGGFAGKLDSGASEIEIQHSSDACTNSSDCPSFTINGGDLKNETFNDVTKKFKIYSGSSNSMELMDKNVPILFFTRKIIFAKNIPHQIYTVKSTGCANHKTMTANIKVITPISWGGKISFGYEKELRKVDQFKTKPGVRKITIGGTVSGKYGDQSFDVNLAWDINTTPNNVLETLFSMGNKIVEALKFLDKIKFTDTILEGTIDTTNKLNDYADKSIRERNKNAMEQGKFKKDSLKLVNFKVDWPKLEISGSRSNTESKNLYKVVSKDSFKVEANPFIGASIKTDALDWIAGLYPIVLEMKQMAAEGYKAEHGEFKFILAVTFEVKGSIGGAVELNKIDSVYESPTCTIKGAMSFSVKAEISVEARIWRLYVSSGASVSLQSAENPSDAPGLSGELKVEQVNNEVVLAGKLSFTGIKVFGAYYAEAGVKGVETAPVGKTTRGKEIKKEAIVKQNIKESKEITTLADPYIIFP